MREAIEEQLTLGENINGTNVVGVLYANERFCFIKPTRYITHPNEIIKQILHSIRMVG